MGDNDKRDRIVVQLTRVSPLPHRTPTGYQNEDDVDLDQVSVTHFSSSLHSTRRIAHETCTETINTDQLLMRSSLCTFLHLLGINTNHDDDDHATNLTLLNSLTNSKE